MMQTEAFSDTHSCRKTRRYSAVCVTCAYCTHFIVNSPRQRILAIAELAVNLLQHEQHHRLVQDSCITCAQLYHSALLSDLLSGHSLYCSVTSLTSVCPIGDHYKGDLQHMQRSQL